MPAAEAEVPAGQPERHVIQFCRHAQQAHRLPRGQGRHGDRANAVLCAAGHNFRLILAWLRLLLRQIVSAIFAPLQMPSALKPAS